MWYFLGWVMTIVFNIDCVGTDDFLSLIEKHARKRFVFCLIFRYYRSYVTWIKTNLAYSMDSLSCACLRTSKVQAWGNLIACILVQFRSCLFRLDRVILLLSSLVLFCFHRFLQSRCLLLRLMISGVLEAFSLEIMSVHMMVFESKNWQGGNLTKKGSRKDGNQPRRATFEVERTEGNSAEFRPQSARQRDTRPSIRPWQDEQCTTRPSFGPSRRVSLGTLWFFL